MLRPVLCFAAAFGVLVGSGYARAGICDSPPTGMAVRCVDPATTNPDLPSSSRLNFAMYRQDTKPGSPLFLWMNGTEVHQRPGPAGAHVKPLRVAVEHGYRAISVPYENQNAIISICPKDPDPACSEKVRRHRLYDGPQSITHRVVSFLRYLDRTEPDRHWSVYINGDHPRWKMITVSGQSQGAGNAAFIAKEHPVDRVILFSSPYDFQKHEGGWRLAPWLSNPSRTAMERWFGGYHIWEPGAKKLEKAYAILGIPDDHIRRFSLDFTPEQRAKIPPDKIRGRYHGQGVGNPAYMADWLTFLGIGRLSDRINTGHDNYHVLEDDTDDE